MTTEEFFTILEKTPSCDLEIELLSRAIVRTKNKRHAQQMEMLRLLSKAQSTVPGRITAVFNKTISS